MPAKKSWEGKMNLLVTNNDVTEREVPPGLGGCEFELRLAVNL